MSLTLFMIYSSIYKIENIHKYLILFIAFLFLNTIIHPYKLDEYTFLRDLITLILICTVALSYTFRNVSLIKIDYILAYSLGVIISENFNIITDYSVSSGEYLNYTSFKFIVIFPILYFLSFKKYYWALIFFPLSFFVVSVYASRMLLLTGILVSIILLMSGLRYYFFRSLMLTIFLGSIILVTLNRSGINFEAYRIFSIFLVFGDFQDFSTAARFLDPVRYAENSIFFGQNLFLLFFGNGLGTGILDVSGFLAFVANDGAAFSPQELSESHYFRLHDSWTWIGYRFGFVAYLMFVFWGVKGCLNKDPKTALFASAMLLALFNASFSIGGLIACAVLALHYKIASRHARSLLLTGPLSVVANPSGGRTL